jgi:hypothetical protein
MSANAQCPPTILDLPPPFIARKSSRSNKISIVADE